MFSFSMKVPLLSSTVVLADLAIRLLVNVFIIKFVSDHMGQLPENN